MNGGVSAIASLGSRLRLGMPAVSHVQHYGSASPWRRCCIVRNAGPLADPGLFVLRRNRDVASHQLNTSRGAVALPDFCELPRAAIRKVPWTVTGATMPLRSWRGSWLSARRKCVKSVMPEEG